MSGDPLPFNIFYSVSEILSALLILDTRRLLFQKSTLV